MTQPWQYDEGVQVGTDYLNEEEVSAYDQRMQCLRDVQKEAVEIGKALSISRDSTIWEIGTGTGECALCLAGFCRQVFATDVSSSMLNLARRKAEQRQIGNVLFETGGFLSGFQPDMPVDAVISQLAFHHLPDFWKSRALEVVAKKLRPNGLFFLRDVVYPSALENYDAFFQAVVEDVRRNAGEEIAAQTIQHIKTEYSTLDWILEGMMDRNGLKVRSKECSGFLTVYVCEKRIP